MKKFLTLSCLAASLSLTGCASILTGHTENLSVETNPAGAHCALSNDKGKWYVQNTPDKITVSESSTDLNYICQKGTKKCSDSLHSSAKPAVFGNLLVGGIIGAAVDAETGAAFSYPTKINCALK